jgi:hypothetical protein
MLGFMKKTVKIVFLMWIAAFLAAPTVSQAESTWIPATVRKAQVSSHLDFSIVIQPSLFVRVDTRHGSAGTAGHGSMRIVSAAISVQGNSGSVTLNSAPANSADEFLEDGMASVRSLRKAADTQQGDQTSHEPARAEEPIPAMATTLAAIGKLVRTQRQLKHLYTDITADSGASRAMLRSARTAGAVVYTVTQL